MTFEKVFLGIGSLVDDGNSEAEDDSGVNYGSGLLYLMFITFIHSFLDVFFRRCVPSLSSVSQSPSYLNVGW